MLTKAIKWTAIAALIGGAFARSSPNLGLGLQFVVVAAAGVSLTQAAIMRRFTWMTLFLTVACLFNPVFPITFSSYTFAMASSFALLLFFFSPYLEHAYHSLLIPVLGFVFLPLTTLTYAWMINSHMPLEGLNLFLLLIAAVIDAGGLGGGEYHRRRR